MVNKHSVSSVLHTCICGFSDILGSELSSTGYSVSTAITEIYVESDDVASVGSEFNIWFNLTEPRPSVVECGVSFSNASDPTLYMLGKSNYYL